ncbi:MAG TPA: hypothetical protein IAD46_04170 [Candidatus Pelethenecus faecipullorum]|uniref:DUF1189 domain-containing protein n=1 Tax=Candidatus Pelethenecus faecipullorum TaxID=2840900 RepID=A0A9D1GS36_9MOLU|nr:hypothetical protein [Candidatus Pelethenecus faecipullorum]
MLDRIRNCICHPKWIGNYFKDKIRYIVAVTFLFLGVYVAVLALRIYTTEPFSEGSVKELTSAVIRGKESDVRYDDTTHRLTGSYCVYEGDDFQLIFLPEQDVRATLGIQILFLETEVRVYYAGMKAQSYRYDQTVVSSFSLADIQKNQSEDIYQFKILLGGVLDSTHLFFQTMVFLERLGMELGYFVILLICMFVFTYFLNPSIEGKIRIKLVFYDAMIFFFVELLSVLFAMSWLQYVALILPIVYANITFRHIVRVVVKQ